MTDFSWNSISSAPKTGEKILLAKIAEIPANETFNIEYHPPFIWWACYGYWSDKYKNWNDGVEPSGLAGPTHWMDLPEPCKEKP